MCMRAQRTYVYCIQALALFDLLWKAEHIMFALCQCRDSPTPASCPGCMVGSVVYIRVSAGLMFCCVSLGSLVYYQASR